MPKVMSHPLERGTLLCCFGCLCTSQTCCNLAWVVQPAGRVEGVTSATVLVFTTMSIIYQPRSATISRLYSKKCFSSLKRLDFPVKALGKKKIPFLVGSLLHLKWSHGCGDVTYAEHKRPSTQSLQTALPTLSPGGTQLVCFCLCAHWSFRRVKVYHAKSWRKSQTKHHCLSVLCCFWLSLIFLMLLPFVVNFVTLRLCSTFQEIAIWPMDVEQRAVDFFFFFWGLNTSTFA